MLCVSGSQLMKHPTLKHSHTIEPRNGPNKVTKTLKVTQTRYGVIYGVQIGTVTALI